MVLLSTITVLFIYGLYTYIFTCGFGHKKNCGCLISKGSLVDYAMVHIETEIETETELGISIHKKFCGSMETQLYDKTDYEKVKQSLGCSQHLVTNEEVKHIIKESKKLKKKFDKEYTGHRSCVVKLIGVDWTLKVLKENYIILVTDMYHTLRGI